MNSKQFNFHKTDVHFLYARYLLTLGHKQDSLNHLNISYQLMPRTMVKMYQIHVLAYLHKFDQALEQVAVAKQRIAGNLKERVLYAKKLAVWEQKLKQLARKQANKTSQK